MDDVCPVTLRAGEPKDWRFVLDSWCRSYQSAALPDLGITSEGEHADAVRVVAGCVQTHLQDRALRLLRRGEVVVAVDSEDPDVLAGWVAYEGPPSARVIHFLYVKHTLRRHGVGSLLLEAVRARGARYSHHTRAGACLASRYEARFAPEAME